jgi:DNA-directed RNA polymerase alpha subunit
MKLLEKSDFKTTERYGWAVLAELEKVAKSGKKLSQSDDYDLNFFVNSFYDAVRRNQSAVQLAYITANTDKEKKEWSRFSAKSTEALKALTSGDSESAQRITQAERLRGEADARNVEASRKAQQSDKLAQGQANVNRSLRVLQVCQHLADSKGLAVQAAQSNYQKSVLDLNKLKSKSQ